MKTEIIKKIPSFQTSDNTLHATKGAALNREYQIQLRGLFQKSSNSNNMQFSSTDVAAILKTHSKSFITLMRKFDDAIRRNTPNINP